MYYSDSYYGYYDTEQKSSAFNAVLDPAFSDEDSIEPVSRETAKHHLKVDSVQDDIKIDRLIRAAREVCEKYLNHSLINRTVTATLNNSCGNIYLPYGPVKEIISVNNSSGTALGTTQYFITGTKFRRLQWPREDNIIIVYTAGYGENCIPAQIQEGILEQIAYMYENAGDQPGLKAEISPIAKGTLKSIRM